MCVFAGCKREPRTQEAAPATPATQVAAAPVAVPSLVERGAYLAKAANCALCHTAVGPEGPDVKHPYAGGLEARDVFGTWHGPNITPDVKTGIGGWTDDQIAAAIREGVRPDGSQLYPIMPYMLFNVMTDADVKAVVAFLRSLPPVERVVTRTAGLNMPKIAAPKPANLAEDGKDPVAHGKYLASLMQCSHCHATLDKTGALAGPDQEFTGGLPMEFPPGSGTVFARNITSDPETGIGKWTEDQVFNLLKTMTKPDGKLLRGPMLFLQGGWSQLDDKDLHAVAAFVKALPPVAHKVPDAAPAPSAPQAAR
jgi:mono/diheme cytochrome c family protein